MYIFSYCAIIIYVHLTYNSLHLFLYPALQEPQNEIGLYSYIVAGVGIAVVAVVSILGLFAVHTVYKRYRMRKDMNLAFKVRIQRILLS